jgi:PQQ-dependent dehydrogenase (s-GDH family)
VKRSLAVAVLLSAALLAAACEEAPPVLHGTGPSSSGNGLAAPGVEPRVLAGGLSNPWQLTWGPDNFLWVTEKTGKRITRINPEDGSSTDVVDIPDVSAGSGEDGLLGMAFGSGAVYVAYDYNSGTDLRGKIVRYSYDQSAASLSSPTDVLTGLPASTMDNGGRLAVGPDQKLYLTLGDQGDNQYANACAPIRSQDVPTAQQVGARDWSSYAGKILRLNPDGGIPADNPMIHGVRSHVFSFGQRNPVGLAFGPSALMYSADQGQKSDDEINLLQAGNNYGWPFVAGYRDDQSYRYANWSAAKNCAQLGYDADQVPPEVPLGPTETQWTGPDYREPLKTLYTVPNGYNFQDPTCGPDYDHCWPTIVPGSLAYLPPDTPDTALANSLLVPSVKNGAVYALKLSQDGRAVQGDVLQLFRTHNRYRDIAVSSDHTKIYIATDNTGVSGPAPGEQSGSLDNPGSILEFALTAPPATPAALTGPSPTPAPPSFGPSSAPTPTPTSQPPTTSSTPTFSQTPTTSSIPTSSTFSPAPSATSTPPTSTRSGNPLLPTMTPSAPSDGATGG